MTPFDAIRAQLDASDLVVVAIGMLLSAIYSGAETAVTGLSEARVRALVDEGGRLQRSLQLWLDKPQHVLTAILVGKKAANVCVAVAASLIAYEAFHSELVAILVAVIAFVLLVFGEITPRSFARHHASTMAPLLFPFVIATYFISWPLVVVFTRFSAFVVSVTGGSIQGAGGPFMTEEDILSVITIGRKEGVLDKVEGRMLASVIELGDTHVREVMVPRTEISALSIDATIDDVMTELRDKGHSRMPVYDSTLDEVRGFFHSKDLLLSDAAARERFRLRDHLRPALFVPELMRTSDLLRLFQKKKTHLAIVVDEFGGTAGVIALEDVIEEIVGPIQDEHDDEEAPFKKIDDTHYTAEGRASLYDLGEALSVSFPEDGGYETLGGFLIARCGRMPRRGDRVVCQGWHFIVKDADEKKVSRIEIEKANPTIAPSVAVDESDHDGQPILASSDDNPATPSDEGASLPGSDRPRADEHHHEHDDEHDSISGDPADRPR